MIQNNSVGGSEQKKCRIIIAGSSVTAWDNDGNPHYDGSFFECLQGTMIAARDFKGFIHLSGEYTEVSGTGGEGRIILFVPHGDVIVSRK